jgi:predicted PhzF superfamily epimerase YddE/YHI9
MRLPIYQVDAFASRVFAGNPAAVVPLDAWLPDVVMQSIAAENNLAETAFFVPANGAWGLRWFTPTVEVDLCGHATLASAWVVFNHLSPKGSAEAAFDTKSGRLTVKREGDLLAMDFPSWPPEKTVGPALLGRALGAVPREVLAAKDLLAVFDTADQVRALSPDFASIAKLDVFAVVVTAPGEGDCDFVSRFFAPQQGIPEDPVTGRAHCMLTPYWSKRLGKRELKARQISLRGGELVCRDRGERVSIAGRAIPYLEGFISV